MVINDANSALSYLYTSGLLPNLKQGVHSKPSVNVESIMLGVLLWVTHKVHTEISDKILQFINSSAVSRIYKPKPHTCVAISVQVVATCVVCRCWQWLDVSRHNCTILVTLVRLLCWYHTLCYVATPFRSSSSSSSVMVMSLREGRALRRHPSTMAGVVVFLRRRGPDRVMRMAPTGAVSRIDSTQITRTYSAYTLSSSGLFPSRTESIATGARAACTYHSSISLFVLAMAIPVLIRVFVDLNTLTSIMCIEQTNLCQKPLHKACQSISFQNPLCIHQHMHSLHNNCMFYSHVIFNLLVTLHHSDKSLQYRVIRFVWFIYSIKSGVKFMTLNAFLWQNTHFIQIYS